VLDGVKAFVPRAAEAELFVVAATDVSDPERPQPGLFIVEPGAPGLTVEPEPGIGVRAAATGRLGLDSVPVAAGARLGDGGPAVYSESVALARLAWCAMAVGTGRAVLDYVTEYVNQRQAFGEPISHRQAVAFTVADMAIELEGLRLVTLRAASRVDQGRSYHREVTLARRLVADRAMRIGSDGVQMLGGHGFTKEHPVERWYRDLRAAGVLEGGLLV
jgi:alkylation response protein AidB-like acyl-CoA dehydrogenase